MRITIIIALLLNAKIFKITNNHKFNIYFPFFLSNFVTVYNKKTQLHELSHHLNNCCYDCHGFLQ